MAGGRKALPVTIAEIGPGRGTLMKDIVRTIGRIAPELADRADFALIEASPRLTAVQQETLRDSGPAFTWHATLDTLPDRAAAHRRQRAVRRPALPPVRQAGRQMA